MAQHKLNNVCGSNFVNEEKKKKGFYVEIFVIIRNNYAHNEINGDDIFYCASTECVHLSAFFN